ncbi:LysM peptidoglycan-binding domain-containing protein [Nakamurella lactea]|uniref:LysM peptidoglycan-binding domain-containing protein n=1 Tax=Nakamurella lactea TaxID=459515 RepID=UPI0004919D7D|nr:LysM domain-containing protein [Nakamurella lactea]
MNRTEASTFGWVWLQLLGSIVALTAIATQLPGPLTATSVVAGTRHVAGPAVLDTTALTAASLLVWSLLVWAIVTAALAVMTRLPGGPGRVAAAALRRVAPTALRRALIAGVGLSLLAGTTACGSDRSAPVGAGASANVVPVVTATAPPDHGTAARGVPSPGPTVADTPTIDQALPDPGPAAGSIDLDWPVHRPGADPRAPKVDLDWPTGAAGSAGSTAPAASTTPASPTAETGAGQSERTSAATSLTVVIVHAGDTLWSLAEHQLRETGGPITDARIDASWRLWYSANRSVIGADPDLILPGQHLHPPPHPAPPAPPAPPPTRANPTTPTTPTTPTNGATS